LDAGDQAHDEPLWSTVSEGMANIEDARLTKHTFAVHSLPTNAPMCPRHAWGRSLLADDPYAFCVSSKTRQKRSQHHVFSASVTVEGLMVVYSTLRLTYHYGISPNIFDAPAKEQKRCQAVYHQNSSQWSMVWPMSGLFSITYPKAA
jgi:hypothetical protein